jgi:hypothetical protein
LQFTVIPPHSTGTAQGRWSSLNRSERPRSELQRHQASDRSTTPPPPKIGTPKGPDLRPARTDTEEVTGSIPVPPTKFCQVSRMMLAAIDHQPPGSLAIFLTHGVAIRRHIRPGPTFLQSRALSSVRAAHEDVDLFEPDEPDVLVCFRKAAAARNAWSSVVVTVRERLGVGLRIVGLSKYGRWCGPVWRSCAALRRPVAAVWPGGR